MNITSSIEDRVATVTVVGDIDLTSTGALRDALQTALAHGDIDAVVVDLGAVTFLDSSALGVLVAARKAAELAGRSLMVSRPGPMVTMVLRVTGLYDILVVDAGDRLTPA